MGRYVCTPRLRSPSIDSSCLLLRQILCVCDGKKWSQPKLVWNDCMQKHRYYGIHPVRMFVHFIIKEDPNKSKKQDSYPCNKIIKYWVISQSVSCLSSAIIKEKEIQTLSFESLKFIACFIGKLWKIIKCKKNLLFQTISKRAWGLTSSQMCMHFFLILAII